MKSASVNQGLMQCEIEWHLYERESPVDNFHGTMTIGEFIEHYICSGDYDMDVVNRMLELLFVASGTAARASVGWNGELRPGNAYVFLIPSQDGYCDMDFGIIWKADNNGNTFICSPRKLDDIGRHIATIARLTCEWASHIAKQNEGGF